MGVGAEEFKPLVVGDDPKQFTLVAIGPETVTIRGGEVRVSGKPNGYFATKESYKNYVLRFEWMYERPEGLKSDAAFKGNSGLLLHIKDRTRSGPKCIEVQLMNVDAGNIFGIPPAKFQGKKDAEAQKKAIKPVGEWNSVEVTCKDGAIICIDQRRRGRARDRRSARSRTDRLAVRRRADPVPQPDDQAARLMGGVPRLLKGLVFLHLPSPPIFR